MGDNHAAHSKGQAQAAKGQSILGGCVMKMGGKIIFANGQFILNGVLEQVTKAEVKILLFFLFGKVNLFNSLMAGGAVEMLCGLHECHKGALACLKLKSHCRRSCLFFVAPGVLVCLACTWVRS